MSNFDLRKYLAEGKLLKENEGFNVDLYYDEDDDLVDLNKAFKGIAASSGNSFVHETESQVILNGSYNINFTMDLVEKDVGLFENVAKKLGIYLEISPSSLKYN